MLRARPPGPAHGVDLLGVDLLGVDLLGVDLLGVDLLGVDLLGVDLLGVDQLGVDQLGVDLLGVDLLGGVHRRLRGILDGRCGGFGVLLHGAHDRFGLLPSGLAGSCGGAGQ